MSLKGIKQLLRAQGFSSVGVKKDGSIIVRKEYFYRSGRDEHQMCATVEAVLKTNNIDATIIDKGDHWAPFRGSASVAQSSHFWVNFKVCDQLTT